MELMKCENDNATEKFYLVEAILKSCCFHFFGISVLFEKYEMFEDGAPAIQLICAGTRLTVYRALPYLNQ